MYQEGYKAGRRSVRKEKSVSDLISRQQAIDAITAIDECENIDISTNEVRELLRELPSAQPEIIRCKDCYYMRVEDLNDGSHFCFCETIDCDTDLNGYCHRAKRRTDETC